MDRLRHLAQLAARGGRYLVQPQAFSTSVAPALTSAASIISRTMESRFGIFVRFFIVVKKILCNSWINILLFFVPAGIAVNQAAVHSGLIFTMNAIAIIPLACLLSFATESLAHELGATWGALLNVSFGNVVELIIFMALKEGHLRIVQSSLLGSILANLLLILGMSFLIGGLRYREQLYNSTVTHMSASLMGLAVLSLLIPTVFYASFKRPLDAEGKLLAISRGSAAILLLVYALYLVFQFKSHAYIYTSTPQHVVDEESRPGYDDPIEMLGISRCARSPPGGTSPSLLRAESHSIGRFSSVLLLFVSTALVAVCAQFMVKSLDNLVKKGPLGELFIGLIILPVLGNAAEHFTAVKIAWKNNMDLAIGIAIGSSIQIALFVTPVVVLIGWAVGKELTLHFHLFESVVLFLAAYVVNFLVLDGRSNYLEGSLLCAAYVMIGIGAYFYPKGQDQSSI